MKEVKDLRTVREALGKSLADVASYCGTTEGSARKWENGGGISLENARKAAEIYGFKCLDDFAAAHDLSAELAKKKPLAMAR